MAIKSKVVAKYRESMGVKSEVRDWKQGHTHFMNAWINIALSQLMFIDAAQTEQKIVTVSFQIYESDLIHTSTAKWIKVQKKKKYGK